MALAFFDWVKQFTGYSSRHRHNSSALLNDELSKYECARLSAKRGGVLQPEADIQAQIVAQRELNFIASHSNRPLQLNSARARQHVPRCHLFLQQILEDMDFDTKIIQPWPVHSDTVSQDIFITCKESLASCIEKDDGTLPMDICCASNQHLDEFVVLLELLTGMQFPRNQNVSEGFFGFASAIRLLCVHDTVKDSYQTLVYLSSGDSGDGGPNLAPFDYVCTLKISDLPQEWLKDHIAQKNALSPVQEIKGEEPSQSESNEKRKKKFREASALDRKLLASFIPVSLQEPQLPNNNLIPVHCLLLIRHGFRNDKVENNLVVPIGPSKVVSEKFKLIGVPKVGEELKIEEHTDDRLPVVQDYLKHLCNGAKNKKIPGLDVDGLSVAIDLLDKALNNKLGAGEQFKVKLWRLPVKGEPVSPLSSGRSSNVVAAPSVEKDVISMPSTPGQIPSCKSSPKTPSKSVKKCKKAHSGLSGSRDTSAENNFVTNIDAKQIYTENIEIDETYSGVIV